MRHICNIVTAMVISVVSITVLWSGSALAIANAEEFEFLDLVNEERVANGLAELGMVPSLHEMAEDWSLEMRNSDSLKHRPGADQVKWVEKTVTADWLRIGENVGYGYSIDGLHDAFMRSPGHRDNVLGDYTHVGVGYVVQPSGRIWVTFNFLKTSVDLDTTGTPVVNAAPSPPVLLNTTRLHPVRPGRLIDTRTIRHDKQPAFQQLDVQVRGKFGVPNDASQVAAAALNVTVADPDGAGFVTVWPTGTKRPNSSNLNPQRPGQIIANQVIVPVGANGRISLFASTATHMIVDIAGWYEPVDESAGGRFVDVSPARVLDTRNTSRSTVAPGTTTDLRVLDTGGVPARGVSAVSVNVTVTEAAGSGYVTAWGGGARPLASNLNTDSRGQTIANQVFVPVSPDGTIRIFNSMAAHLVVDVTGYFTDETAPLAHAGLFVPVNPYRAVDTREYLVRSRVAATWDLDLRGDGWRAAALNVTIVDASGLGYATVWGGGDKPKTSTVNADRRGQTIPNAATVNGDGDSAIRIYTNQETHVLIDVNGFYVQ